MYNKLNIYVSLAAIVILVIFVLVLPADEGAEVFENRVMQAFPELTQESFLSGDFFNQLESFLLDNTAHRTTWLAFAQAAEYGYGINLSGGAMMVVFDGDDLGYGLVPLDDELVLGHTPGEDAADFSPVQVITHGRVNPMANFSEDVHFNENAVFYLRYNENQVLAARYAEVLNAYFGDLPDNVRMFSMLAPVKVEFMGPRYAAVNSSQLGTIEFVNNLLHPGIIPVDTHTILSDNADRYTFFRLDHHWTALGAYFAYLAFAEAAGFEPITIENYTEHVIHGFIGSLAVGTRNRTVLAHPDTIYFYTLDDGTTFSIDMFTIPADMAHLSYRVFLGGDRDYFSFTSSNTNGRTLMVIKDSFANALIPWIAPHYENIVVIDPRQFTGSVRQVMELYNDIDLLFVNYMPATTMSELIEQIYNAR